MSYYALRQELGQFLQVVIELQNAHVLYGIGKLAMSSSERRDLDAFVKAIGPAVDPYSNARILFSTWNAKAEMYLQQFKKSAPLVKAFSSEKSSIRKQMEKRKPEIASVVARTQQLLIYLDNLNANAPLIMKEVKPARLNPPKLPNYDILKSLEARLREYLQTSLAKLDANWWKSMIPDDVRRNAEERKVRREVVWSWHGSADLHPIFYVDFADYAKIIGRRDNWERVFKNVFHDRDSIVTRLRELEPIRNDIAHSREITKRQMDRLKLYAEDILDKLK